MAGSSKAQALYITGSLVSVASHRGRICLGRTQVPGCQRLETGIPAKEKREYTG